MEKQYLFSVSGHDEKQCLEKMQAAKDILKSLKHDDLRMLANAVKSAPGLIDQARPLLNKYKV